MYHQLCAPISGNTTLRTWAVRDIATDMRRGSHPLCRPLPRDLYLGIHWRHVETPQCNVQENLLSGLSCSQFVRHYWGNPLQFRLLRSLICLNSAGGPVHALVRSSNYTEHWTRVPEQCIQWHVTPEHLPDHTLIHNEWLATPNTGSDGASNGDVMVASRDRHTWSNAEPDDPQELLRGRMRSDFHRFTEFRTSLCVAQFAASFIGSRA